MTSIAESEKIVEQYLAKNDNSSAVESLYEMVVQCARAKRFSKAEKYREWIMEVDPMALNEIISSAEIIEDAKSHALDPIHMEIWSRLYSSLDKDEKNALFFSMKEAKYGINQTIYSQGYLNSNLYFINHGNLKLIFSQKGGDFFLSALGSGDIAGQENFFSNTVCTESLVTTTDVILSFIEKNVLLQWKKDFPNLEHKLKEFCQNALNISHLLKRKKIDRRTQNRIKISGIGLFNLLNSAGEPIGKPFKGELNDISLGGLSFDFRISKVETAQLLVGRRINIKFTFIKSTPKIKINQNGLIVGANSNLFNNYSIQVKFDKMLDRSIIASIQHYLPCK